MGDNDPSELLFIWECLSFFLTLEGQAGQIKASWPTLLLWALWVYQSTAFWPPRFLMKILLKTFLRNLVCDESPLSHCFQDSLFIFDFWNLIIMCLSVSFFQFILLGVSWAFWMFLFVSFINFQKFSALISSNSLSAFFNLLFLGLPQCVCWFTPTGH